MRNNSRLAIGNKDPRRCASGEYASHREIYSFHERSIQRGGMRNFCVRVASHRRVPASRKSPHGLGAWISRGLTAGDQRQSDGIFDKAIFWFVHSAAMGAWSSDYGIARVIVDREINNPPSRRASQLGNRGIFARERCAVQGISPALRSRVSSLFNSLGVSDSRGREAEQLWESNILFAIRKWEGTKRKLSLSLFCHV